MIRIVYCPPRRELELHPPEMRCFFRLLLGLEPWTFFERVALERAAARRAEREGLQ